MSRSQNETPGNRASVVLDGRSESPLPTSQMRELLGPIRTYEVTLRGWPPHLYSARSPSKARVQCWHAYSAYDDRCDFRSFLRLVQSVRVAENPPAIGERILVCGKPATRVLGRGGTANYFMWDDGDAILTAHPSEIALLSPPPVHGEGDN